MTSKGDWRRLRGRAVRVTASGVEYRGVVVELGEEALLLRGDSGFREIPWTRITQIDEAPAGPAPKLRR